MPQARKRFGQHFLHDQRIIERILGLIDPQPGQNLLEIGPGRGALTYPLLQRCKKLTAVELDRDLVPILQRESARFGELEVINADVLDFQLPALTDTNKYRLVGNLPYNISTPLMFHLLKSVTLIEDMHFMVQNEVALRIGAAAGETNYGRLSVMLQYHCRCQYLIEVPPSSFTPPPRVDSAVIRLVPHQTAQRDIGDYEIFSQVVQTAFAQRRKTISNSLKTMVDKKAFAACEIDPGLRAENLSVDDFARLSHNLYSENKHA